MSERWRKRKLHTTSGATILLALLFFLLCAVAGSVVLAAGTAASGRIAGLTDRQQTYYSVSSAARLIRNEIEGQKVSLYTKTGDTTGTIYYNEKFTGKWEELLESLTEQVVKVPGQASYSDVNLTITPTPEWDDYAVDPVQAVMSIDSDYNLVIQITADNAEMNDKTYACTMKIPAAVAQNAKEMKKVDGDTMITIQSTVFTWDNAIIEKAE